MGTEGNNRRNGSRYYNKHRGTRGAANEYGQDREARAKNRMSRNRSEGTE
jgi:hypothetical protein